MCTKEILPVKEANSVLQAPAADGSTWWLMDGIWHNASSSFREDFKYKSGEAVLRLGRLLVVSWM